MTRYWIVIGDLTTHGGRVVSGSQFTNIDGKPVARIGDYASCPKCGGPQRIVSGDQTAIVDGQPVARERDYLECGAQLISTQQSRTFIEDGADLSTGLAASLFDLRPAAPNAMPTDEMLGLAARGDPKGWAAQVGGSAAGPPRRSPEQPAPMQLSSEGLAMLKRVETLRTQPYDDQTGRVTNHWVRCATIGYGHLIKPDEWATYSAGISAQDADVLMMRDLAPKVAAVNDGLTRAVTQQQFDALTVLCFNIGEAGSAQSSALQLVNDPDAQTAYGSVDAAWRAWNQTQGHESRGMNNRRAAELRIFHSGDYSGW